MVEEEEEEEEVMRRRDVTGRERRMLGRDETRRDGEKEEGLVRGLRSASGRGKREVAATYLLSSLLVQHISNVTLDDGWLA